MVLCIRTVSGFTRKWTMMLMLSMKCQSVVLATDHGIRKKVCGIQMEYEQRQDARPSQYNLQRL